MRQSLKFVLALLSVVSIGAPAGAQQNRGDRNKLTQADIAETGTSIMTARDAVRILRPQWMTPPPLGRQASSDVLTPGGGSPVIIIYINDVRQPDIESLATVPAAKVVEMKYLDQNRAVMLHGPGHESGVIEVTTTDRRK
ncbi:MAG: hypothetical protein ABIT20_12205 [Gemmatimonadaceae bacterium]